MELSLSSNFIYHNRDHKFIIKEWLEGEKIFALDRFKDYLSVDDVDQILDQALKACKDVVAPTMMTVIILERYLAKVK